MNQREGRRPTIKELHWLVEWLTTGEVGLSSRSLATWAVLGQPRPGWRYSVGEWWEPSDSADLRRCEKMFASAPPPLQERMLPKLMEWRRKVAKRYGVST